MCRFRYYNPRASWVLKQSSFPRNWALQLLQPTCIVGTKTGIPLILIRTIPGHYNPRVSWVLKLTARRGCLTCLHYNPRVSWVLKLIGSYIISSAFSLQPTCIVGTKTRKYIGENEINTNYNPRVSWVLKHRILLRFKAVSFQLQPTCIVGTKIC